MASAQGPSLRNSSSSATVHDPHHLDYCVACELMVENQTRWQLQDPVAVNVRGYIKIPPSAIQPGSKKAMITHKNGGTTTGTCGTVVWKVSVAGSEFYILVMWSVPFNQNHYSNWLAIGLTQDETVAQSSNLFNKMYYNDFEWFVRQEYYRDSRTIRITNSYVELEGIMGTNHKPEVKIVVKPKEAKDYAPGTKQF